MYLFNTEMANGWRHIATAFYGVADALYPPPRHLVRQLSELCPGFCMLWCVKVYRTEGNGEVRRGYHMICRHVPEPRADLEPVNIDIVGRDFPYPAKLIYESRLLERPRPKTSRGNRYPADYAPLSEWWVHELRRMWWERNRLDQKRMEKTAAAHVAAVKEAREAPLRAASDQTMMAMRSRRAAIRQAIRDDLEGKPPKPELLPNRVYSLPARGEPLVVAGV